MHEVARNNLLLIRPKWYGLLSICLFFTSLAFGQQERLEAHLKTAAEYYKIDLVYSSSTLPDTTFAFEIDEQTSASTTFARLTRPYGLSFAMLSDKVVISSVAVQRFNVNGFIVDASSGERLVGATVFSLSQKRGTTTNGYGYFSIGGLTQGELLAVQYVGYPSDTLEAIQSKRDGIVIKLKPAYNLRTIEVLAQAVVATSFPVDAQPVPRTILDDAEFVSGDRDINIWLSQRPAIQSAAAGFGGYSIRGADPTHNLVMLDDATLYLPSHAAGFLSAVPGAAIQSLELHKNAGPAKYGDRIGGVLDLRLKEGSREKRISSISFGSTDINGFTEGPIGKGSYFLMGRRGLSDFWLRFLRPSVASAESSIPNIDYRFFDVTGKVNYPLGDRHRIYASFFRGVDYYEDQDETFTTNQNFVDGLLDRGARSWVNAIASFRHNVTLGTRWFVNTTLTLSEFEYQADDFFFLRERINTPQQRNTTATILFQTKLRDIGWKQDAEFMVRPGLRMKFGVDVTAHRFEIGTDATEQASEASTEPQAPESDSLVFPQTSTYDASAYVSFLFQPTKKLSIRPGLRLSTQVASLNNFFAALPRIDLKYRLDSVVQLHAEAGMARQYIHSISTENPGLPRDLWVPSVDGVQPMESAFANIGCSYVLPDKVSVAGGAFYQRFTNLSRFPPDFIVSNFENWSTRVQQGRGVSYGLEAEIQIPTRAVLFEAGYTFSNSTRQFNDRFGESLPVERYRLDRRHFGTFRARYLMGKSWSLGATWRIGSGLPTRVPRRNPAGPTLPDSNIPLTNWWNYDGPQVELRPYHALDLGIRRIFVKDKVEYRFSFGVQNIYLRKNPLLLNLQRIPDALPGESQFQLTQVLMLPILPFMRYSVTF